MANIKFAKQMLTHPDRDDIISRLSSGHTPKDISLSLKTKYQATNPELCFNEKNLKEFQDVHLDFYKAVMDDVKATKQIVAIHPDDVNKELSKVVKGNSKYRQKLLELTENKIDFKNFLANAIVVMESRIAELYESVTSDVCLNCGHPIPNTGKKVDYHIINYFNAMSPWFDKYMKYVEEKPDTVIQQNISIEYADKRFSILEEAVRMAISKFDVETAMLFMSSLEEELQKAQLKESVNNNELTLADTSELKEDLQKIIGKTNE